MVFCFQKYHTFSLVYIVCEVIFHKLYSFIIWMANNLILLYFTINTYNFLSIICWYSVSISNIIFMINTHYNNLKILEIIICQIFQDKKHISIYCLIHVGLLHRLLYTVLVLYILKYTVCKQYKMWTTDCFIVN